MVQGTSLSYEVQSGDAAARHGVSPEASSKMKQGIRTQVLLVLAMALGTAIVTVIFLVLIQHRLRAQVTEDFSLDLQHSVVTFQNLQAERFDALNRENALLAELPTLKALMTSGDRLTIQDGAVEFWQLSGDDLFALADPAGKVVAVYTSTGLPNTSLQLSLDALVRSSHRHYLVVGNSLYDCSVRPLYFGSDRDGTVLGYVISGNAIERTVRQISGPTGVEATFVSDGQVLASTLANPDRADLSTHTVQASTPQAPSTISLKGNRYLAATEDLSGEATSPLRLVLLKSFAPAEQAIRRIDRIILSAGLLALIAGTCLMIALARLMTRPLEDLSRGVRAFGMGDGRYRIPGHGTQEIRQLSAAFASMREEIQQTSRALLESERLATIGRMANSVSHDLRHYLAAVYANAEFLASGRLSAQERDEIFADIRAAVFGTTDMIESLLIFSRTGTALRRTPEALASLIEHAIQPLRAHPDAEGVQIVMNSRTGINAVVNVDGKQIERAIYNLALNACQAARSSNVAPCVTVSSACSDGHFTVEVTDNGHGVSENIRGSLFQPFVSEGRQKGTGLGLTLVHRIAEEHGGTVALIRSEPGETIFQMKITSEVMQSPTEGEQIQRSDEVNAYEKQRI